MQTNVAENSKIKQYIVLICFFFFFYKDNAVVVNSLTQWIKTVLNTIGTNTLGV